jgi:hypothetical protein
MKRIPDAQAVDKALRSARVAVKQALRGLNQAAAQQMAKGNYGAAEALVAKGREIQQFQAEVDALRKRWRDVRRGGAARQAKKATTSMWAYYQPILKALADAGGEARRAQLEPLVERLMGETLQSGDHEPLGRGTERWQVVIGRARKHLAAEGWIERGPSPTWRITESGRRAASKPLGPPKGTEA